MGEVGGPGTGVLVANVIGDVVAEPAGDAVLRGGSVAVVAAGVAPVAAAVLVDVLAVGAGVEALGVVEHEVGVAGEALVFRGAVAAPAVARAALACPRVGVEAEGALGHALRLVFAVEGEEIEVGGAGEAVVEGEAVGALGVALAAGAALAVGEVGSGARRRAAALVKVELRAGGCAGGAEGGAVAGAAGRSAGGACGCIGAIILRRV